MELRPGIYEIGHHGGSDWPPGYSRYPRFDNLPADPERVSGAPGPDGMFDYEYEESLQRGSYGVCDSVENLLARYPELEAPGRRFLVTMTPVDREDQPSDGGWRWHKWGRYIGNQKPLHEYLYHDRHIDKVYCYHIYEKVSAEEMQRLADELFARLETRFHEVMGKLPHGTNTTTEFRNMVHGGLMSEFFRADCGRDGEPYPLSRYHVHIDDSNNPQAVVDAGECVAEVAFSFDNDRRKEYKKVLRSPK